MSRSRGYVDAQYLLSAAVRLQALKQRSYELMRVQEGQALLDLGCGPGTDTIALASLVGATGTVIGVDHDPEMVEQAQVRARHARVAGWVDHCAADACALPFASNTFDACRADRVFQHLRRPEEAFAELVRVTKPAGWIVVVDSDYGTLSVDTPEVDLERRLVRFGAEHCLNNGYAGRQLFRLFGRHRCTDTSIAVVPSYATSYAELRSQLPMETVESEALGSGVIAPEELRRLQLSLERADDDGVFFCSMNIMVIAGRKFIYGRDGENNN